MYLYPIFSSFSFFLEQTFSFSFALAVAVAAAAELTAV